MVFIKKYGFIIIALTIFFSCKRKEIECIDFSTNGIYTATPYDSVYAVGDTIKCKVVLNKINFPRDERGGVIITPSPIILSPAEFFDKTSTRVSNHAITKFKLVIKKGRVEPLNTNIPLRGYYFFFEELANGFICEYDLIPQQAGVFCSMIGGGKFFNDPCMKTSYSIEFISGNPNYHFFYERTGRFETIVQAPITMGYYFKVK